VTTTVANATFEAQARAMGSAAIRSLAAEQRAHAVIQTEFHGSAGVDPVINVSKLADALDALATEVED
jgi:hypothetical protein